LWVIRNAYAAGAESVQREVRRIDVAHLDFPLLRTHADWETGTPPASMVAAQETIGWAEHLVVVYPLWQGMMPALLKGFFEQVFRPGFAKTSDPRLWMTLLKGRSARIVVTMGMPALFYRWYFGAHGLKSLERSILSFIGVRPIRETLIGTVESLTEKQRKAWLEKLRALGERGR
jgi:putative NADPH-quinone reductase